MKTEYRVYELTEMSSFDENTGLPHTFQAMVPLFKGKANEPMATELEAKTQLQKFIEDVSEVLPREFVEHSEYTIVKVYKP